MNPPEEIDDGFKVLRPLYHLIANYVPVLYGWTDIKTWLNDNEGKSVLDLFTTSDIAYMIVLLLNSGERWEKEFEISKMSAEEQDKWDNPGLLSPEELVNYTKPSPKYTPRKGRKATYLGHGWKQEGVDKFNKIWEEYKKRVNDKVWYEGYELGWEGYVEDFSVWRHWKKKGMRSKKASLSHAVSMEKEEEVLPRNLFAMPGDEDFEGDCAWKKKSPAAGGVTDGIDEFTNSSSDSGDEEDDDSVETPPPSKKRSRKIR